MTLVRQRLITLAYGDMETVRIMPATFAELDMIVRDWARMPPDAPLQLRIPVEFASIQAARYVSGPYIYLNGEDTYQIAGHGVQGLRVEIIADAAIPVDEPPPPPPPPVLEMPATFALELVPGQTVELETTVSDEFDMSRMDDGTVVDGVFWGKLDIVHQGDTHKMEFSGTRLPADEYSPGFLVDSRVIGKLASASQPPVAKCHLSILTPEPQFCDVFLSFSSMWDLGVSWPPAEVVEEKKVKYFCRVHPGGALEHFESQMVATSIYYEAIPDPNLIDPPEMISPHHGFAMSLRDFLPHLMNVLDQLGLSLHARTVFVNNNISAFAAHKNIAYRFLSPGRIARAIDISVNCDPCVFTRLFMMFRGVSDEELMSVWAGAGEKEANQMNWREVVGWTEDSKDQALFRVLETSILDVT